MANTSEGRGNLPTPPPRTVPLRIIRLPLSKPWRKPAPPPPRVFSVHPRDFRRLVQTLTGTGAAEPMAEASPVIPTPPQAEVISSAAPKVPVPPAPLSDSSVLHHRPAAITANAMEHNDGGPAKYPEFLCDWPFPANSDWSSSPIWSAQETAAPPPDDCDSSNLFPYF